MLSDLGAEVIKIEKPDGGDETRAWGPPLIDGISYCFISLNRGDKSVASLEISKDNRGKVLQKVTSIVDTWMNRSFSSFGF